MLFFGANKKIQKLRYVLDEAYAKIAGLESEVRSTQAILESMVEGVAAIDKDGRIVSINSSAEKIFGIARKEAEGRLFLEAFRNNDIAGIIDDVSRNGKFISRELSLVWPVRKDLRVNAAPIFEKSSPGGCLLVIHDITEIRRLEKIRTDFIANVSHELKTPLTSIRGFVETLLEGALEDKENNRRFLRIIQDHTRRLDNLLNDLLSLSYLESKEISLEKSAVNLREAVEETMLGFKTQLKKKLIELKNDLPSGLMVKADRARIEQVFTNLIDNAIKFNRENGFIKVYCRESDGLVEPRAHARGTELDRVPPALSARGGTLNRKLIHPQPWPGLSGSWVKVTVEDSGIGIPEKDVGRIFERFYRVDKARSRELGGTGLGLSIVKHIVELHGGSVGVESVEGLGSKFHFTLPL